MRFVDRNWWQGFDGLGGIWAALSSHHFPGKEVSRPVTSMVGRSRKSVLC